MQDYKQTISESLQKVVSEHGYQGVVQNRDIHEQALSHRLAHHLENSNVFTGYHIDCEYNRHGEKTKTDSAEKGFKPDIIVHIRGNDESNLVMIETKKFNDPKKEINDIKGCLKRRSDEYGYSYAFLVIFPESEVTDDSVVKI